MVRTFSALLDRGIKTKYFLLAVALVALFRILDFLPIVINYYAEINGEFYIGYSTMELYELIGYTMFGLIMLVVPVIPYSGAYCDDINSNLSTYLMVKSGKNAYCVSSVLVCAVSSFLCVFIGEMIVVVGFSCLTPYFNIKYYTMSEAAGWLLLRIVLLSLQGSFYGTVTMLMSVFTSNKYIIFTTPVLLYFFFMLFGIHVLNISTKINPALVFRNFVFHDGKEVESVILAVVYLFFLIFITSRVMYKKIERCY